MIARIVGTLIYKSFDHVIIDAYGIGYRIFVPLTTFYELPEAGQSVTLTIHTHVKQDAISLFGFNSSEDKEIFQLMIAVTGIGPRLAMNILSGISADELIRAVSQGNLSRLVSIPGVGKKMGERMILELKDKVVPISSEEMVSTEVSEDMKQHELVKEDALSALVNLGYKKGLAKEIIDKVVNGTTEPITIDIVLKESLRILAG
ncbi:MAG: Holliday junction branch migration protein RuvA [Deltaproteobacteria bacterium]|nr:Holliday junction branch migration protein RuvA [Deltaproteobacteria bacterium]